MLKVLNELNMIHVNFVRLIGFDKFITKTFNFRLDLRYFLCKDGLIYESIGAGVLIKY